MKDRRTKPVRIILFGHFGQYNFGNESTLQAMLYHIRRRIPNVEVTCICTGPQDAAAAHGIVAIPIAEAVVKPWTSRNPLIRLLRKVVIGVPSEVWRWLMAFSMLTRTDMFVVPGTGLLTDAFGLMNWGPYSMFKWCLLARMCGCRVLFVSVGAGPVSGRLARFFLKSALSFADFRSYRDESTMTYLEGIGVRTNGDRVCPDLAFGLPDAGMPHVELQKARRRVVGLGLMHHASMYGGGKPSDVRYAGYMESLVMFVDWLLAEGYDIRLLIGDLGDRSTTREFGDRLKERIPAAREGRVLDDPVSCVDDLLTQLGGTDVVVATRFHNVLLALLLNKPVISISFHSKCSSLMSAMGLSDYIQDINGLRADRLIERFRALETNADRLKDLIRGKTEQCAGALDEQYDFIFRKFFCPADEPCGAVEELIR